MYTNIMIPVDLAHVADLGKALDTGADLARHYGARICYVGVTAATPSAVAHNPAEFQQKLESFATEQGVKHGITTMAKAAISHDPAVDLDSTLLKTADEIGADLIVVASHIPGLKEYIWPSNGGALAGHATASVFVVRL